MAKPNHRRLQNRRARFDYDLQTEFTAGLVLHGHEVKSLRAGQVDLEHSFITFKNGEAWLTNAHIKQYQHAGDLPSYEPTRPRKLLLNARELAQLAAAKQQKLTIVPLAVIFAGPFVKLRLAIARGKKKYDKRESIKRRDMDREARRIAKAN